MLQPSSDAGASNLPPAHTPSYEPRREKTRMFIYGSLQSIDRLIKILHLKEFAEPHEWSDPLPTERPGEWMVILTRQLMIG